MDTSTMKEDELNIMQKEFNEIELRQIPRPPEELFEIAKLIYERNSAGIKPSFSEIGAELSLSKPTFRKRVRNLISSGYVVEVSKGNRKVLELTQKGRSLFFK
jgi:Mn-dependent DtxR family transcriptional regulator